MSLLADLFSYWKLDEASGTRFDSHGSNDLTDNNTVGAASGIISNGADFEASDTEYLSRGSGLLDGLTDLAISFWAKRESVSSGAIYGQGTSTSTFFEAAVFAGVTTFRVFFRGTLSNQDVIVAPVSISTTQFDHFIVNRTATSVDVYQNNSLIATTSVSSGGAIAAAVGAGWSVGRQPSGSGGDVLYFDGVLDEFGVWERTLTSDERTALYNGGAGLAYPFSTGQTITVNQASETDTASAVAWAPKKRLAGQAAETDLSQAITRHKTKDIGEAAEIDLAQAVTHAKRVTLGQPSETDLAQAVTRGGILVNLGQASETDLARPLTAHKTLAIGIARETDTSRSMTPYVARAPITTGRRSRAQRRTPEAERARWLGETLPQEVTTEPAQQPAAVVKPPALDITVTCVTTFGVRTGHRVTVEAERMSLTRIGVQGKGSSVVDATHRSKHATFTLSQDRSKVVSESVRSGGRAGFKFGAKHHYESDLWIDRPITEEEQAAVLKKMKPLT